MNWTDFVIWISLGYLGYYGSNILLDKYRQKHVSGTKSEEAELVFSENFEIVTVGDLPPKEEEEESLSVAIPNPPPQPDIPKGEDEGLAIRESITETAGGVRDFSRLLKLAVLETIEIKQSLVY